MNFETYLNQAWADHAKDPIKVTKSFSFGQGLAVNSNDISQIARLAAHVYGEHLGLWPEGIKYLKTLETLPPPLFDPSIRMDIHRYILALRLAMGEKISLSTMSTSDQVRVFASAASYLAERNTGFANYFFQQAIELAETIQDSNDPANRTMAITGNNLACFLEEKSERNQEENDLMILWLRKIINHTGIGT